LLPDAAGPAAGQAPPLPLARWATRRLLAFAQDCRIALPFLSGGTLLGERAALDGFRVPGTTSAGGGCRLHATQDGWIALNLARAADRELLPALLETGDVIGDAAIGRTASGRREAELVARGREMGLAIAGLNETAPAQDITHLCIHPAPVPVRMPLVVDLSALWAGPLCGHLLRAAGAEVIKVENPARPDRMREGDAGLFARLNQGKHNVALDPKRPEDRAVLVSLLERADIVIEASRPRALRQLGIDAQAILARKPGMVWLTITAHGASGAAADWTGFGDDCAVAGGLSAAMRDASGTVGFVGDAPADPLTGIVSAHEGWRAWTAGEGGRIGFAMSGIVRAALADERAHSPERWREELRLWARLQGTPFPPVLMREPEAPLHRIGQDNHRWAASC